jgi:hypothetical protein
MAGDGVEAGAVSRAGSGVSRRSVLGGAGKVAAAGAALTAAGAIVVPEVAGANTSGGIAVSPKGTTAIEFLVQIQQNGADMIAYGYLTEVAGLSQGDLFVGTPSDTTARLTAYATGKVVGRTTSGQVHNLDLTGDLTIYSLPGAGASFAHPATFKSGSPVARYALTIQDILTVIATDTGLPTLFGDLRQTQASALGSHGKFGQSGTKLRLQAAGFGTRQVADPPVATLTVAGNLATA